jgi:hypothetical protein
MYDPTEEHASYGYGPLVFFKDVNLRNIQILEKKIIIH